MLYQCYCRQSAIQRTMANRNLTQIVEKQITVYTDGPINNALFSVLAEYILQIFFS